MVMRNMLMKVTNWVAAEFHAKAYTKADGYCSISRGPETLFQLTQHNTEPNKVVIKKISQFLFHFYSNTKIYIQYTKSYPTDEIYKMTDNIEQGQASLFFFFFSTKHRVFHSIQFSSFFFSLWQTIST